MNAENGEKAVSERQGNQRSEISEALRREVIRLATEGDDKVGGNFTPEVAARIERVVLAGRTLLMAEKISAHDAEAMLRWRRKNLLGGGSMVAGDELDDYALGNDMLSGSVPMVMSSPAENFGMSAIRELISAARGVNESPSKLVEALAVARHEGLTDVAAELEKKLGVTKDVKNLTVSVSGTTDVGARGESQ